jgi:3-keto-disaccharide hydrolase
MWRHSLLLLALLAPRSSFDNRTAPLAHVPADQPLLGRWDITIRTPDGERPSWLELSSSGRDATVGQFVGIVGSARPISRVIVTGDSLHFAIPHQWENGDGDLTVEGRLTNGRLAGAMIFPDGKRYDWTGVRAPELRRDHTPTWGALIRLLRPNDLGGWKAVGGSANQWVVSNGVLRSPHSGANIETIQTFKDFKLHIEFRYPAESNSGVYLRGRHEVQIQDDYGLSPLNDRFSGVYGFISPSEIAAKKAGEWQTYDITLVGRMVTVVANGKRVICDQEIPGITGGAIDSNEGEPGPLLLQGDHGPVEFRNITITPAMSSR